MFEFLPRTHEDLVISRHPRTLRLIGAVFTVAMSTLGMIACSDRSEQFYDEGFSEPALQTLAQATFTPTVYTDLENAVDAAYQVVTMPNGQRSRNPQAENLYACRTGRPDQGAAMKSSNRLMGCLNLVVNLVTLYQAMGSEAAYQAAVRAANYYLTEYPAERRKFNDLIAARLSDFVPGH